MNAIAPASVPSHGPQLDNKRVLAGLIDLFIVGIVAAIVLSAAGFVGGDGSKPTFALRLLALGWALFYYFALESGAGQTLGKRFMGLRVVMADGSPVDMAAVGKRTVLRVIDGIGLYVVGLVTMLATGQRRQRLGDMVAGTIVTSASAHPVAAGAPSQAASAPSAPTFEPGTIPPLPVLDTPMPVGPETPMPGLDVAPASSPAPAAHPLPDAPAVPELKPFDPFATTPADNGGAPDASAPDAPADPVVDVAQEPDSEAPVDPMAAASPEFSYEAPVEPVIDGSPEPVVEVEAPVEPTFGFMPEPAVEVTPEPQVDVAPEPELEAASEPVVEIEPSDEPAAEAAPAMDWGFSHGPAPTTETDSPEAAAPESEPAEDEVKVRSVETVSAIDLVMGELEEDEAAGPATTA